MIYNIMLELIVLCFSVAANLALAVLIFAKNTQKNVNRYFALFAVVLVAWSITNYISVHPVIFEQLFWIRLDMALAVFMSMSLLLLINVFPSGNPFYLKLLKLIIVPSIVLAGLAFSPWLFTHVDYSSGSPQPVPGPVMVPFALYTLFVLGLSITILVRRFLSFEGKAREYIRYAIVGMATTFSLIVIFNFVLVVAFHNTFFIDFTPAVVLIFSISFVYGIIRRQLFDIRLIVARFVAYLLLLLFAGALYGFAAVAVSSFIVGVQPNFLQIALSTVVVGILILFAQPLRQFFNRITRTLFYQDDYDTKHVLDQLATVLVHSIDTNRLANESMTTLQSALKSEYITMLLIDESKEERQRLISVGDAGPDLTHLSAKKLFHGSPGIVVTDMVEGEPDQIHQKMQELNVAVVARLGTHSGVVGYCFFGYKTSGSAYGRRDIDLIRIASDELAIAIQNAMSVQAVKDINATLQQRIQEATKELRASNTQLHRLDAAKDEFVSMASHQLRTPLTSVKGYISMVLEGDAGKITAMQRQLLEEAFTSSERMVHLISDFLNVSRLQTGKFIIEQRPVDLAKIISQEVESLQTTASAHDLKLKFRAPTRFPVLYVDEAKMRQVVMNFIDNAIYYSSENTTINVELSVVDGSAVLEVRDTGIGVPASEQAHLFTKFFRASNARKQRPDGTGVGLFLAKKVVLAHSGTILFKSTEGEGSTFGFRLPIKKLSSPAVEDTDKLKK